MNSPDFALGFPEIERRRFLVGETGFSDTGALTRRRIQDWLENAAGDVRIRDVSSPYLLLGQSWDIH